MTTYIEFLKEKMAISQQTGFNIDLEEISPTLYPHVKIPFVGRLPVDAAPYFLASVCKRQLPSWKFFG